MRWLVHPFVRPLASASHIITVIVTRTELDHCATASRDLCATNDDLI